MAENYGIATCMACTSEKELSVSRQIDPYWRHGQDTSCESQLWPEALDMDIRYISEPEKVEAERKAKEEAAQAVWKALAKREAAREKVRLKA